MSSEALLSSFLQLLPQVYQALRQQQFQAVETFLQRHQVDHPHATLGAGHVGLEHQRLAHIAARRAGNARGGGQAPLAVVGIAEQRTEHRRAVKARDAEPVDGSVAGDECAGALVADKVAIDAYLRAAAQNSSNTATIVSYMRARS